MEKNTLNTSDEAPQTKLVWRPTQTVAEFKTSKGESVEVKIIAFSEWRKAIAPLWEHLKSTDSVTPFDNPHGIVRYHGLQPFERILVFPLQMELNGRPIGWTSVYNISDDAVRIRGLYVLPEYRGSGLGLKMCDAALSMWPAGFKRCYGLWRDSAFSVLKRKWNLVECPGYTPRKVVLRCGSVAVQSQYAVVFGYKDIKQNSVR